MEKQMQDMKWYMVTTVSGKEEQVLESLKNRVIFEKLQDKFEDFMVMMVPTISAKELEKKKHNEPYKIRNKNLYPGYFFIKMDMTDYTWFLVRNTQYVTGLVGSSGQKTKPTPVSNSEMKKMQNLVEKIKSDFSSGKIASNFKVGKIVEIIDGPNKGQIGAILENNDEKEISQVEVVLFERKQPVWFDHKMLKIK